MSGLTNRTGQLLQDMTDYRGRVIEYSGSGMTYFYRPTRKIVLQQTEFSLEFGLWLQTFMTLTHVNNLHI